MANYPITISYAILGGTSIYCWNRFPSNIYLTYGNYGLTIFHSCLGILKFVTDENNDGTFNSIYETTKFLQDVLVLPCTVSTILMANSYRLEMAQINLCLPIIPIFINYYQEESTDEAIDAMVALNSITLAYVSYELGSFFGFSAAAIYAIDHFIIGRKNEGLNRTTYLDLYNLELSIFQYLALLMLEEGGVK